MRIDSSRPSPPANLRFRDLLAAAASAVLLATAQDAAAQSFQLEPKIGFPDFGFMESPGDYDGPVFVLSDNYPRDLPPPDAGVGKILAIDFNTDWEAYAMAVRDYVFEGNITGNVENDFILQNNTVRPWYHVPWQHWGTTGREGYHGLTQEGPLSAHSLSPSQTIASHAYAVGFYNAQGGYAIGQVWPTTEGPDLSFFINGGDFPVGTVVAKFLFTTLGSDQVPYLQDPLQWNAYVYQSDVPGGAPGDPAARTTAKVNLLQMDIMVRDGRADQTGGWVFGTFVYNGALGNQNRWANLMPVGILWGNDPEVILSETNPTPTQTIINPALRQTIINPSPDLPPMHLGWNSRLNGPADNPASSCMSCHSTAQFPTVSAIMPFLNQPPVAIPADGTDAGADWMRWFRNLPGTEAFDAGEAVPLAFSLQLTKSIQNFVQYQSGIQQGKFAVEYWGEADDHPVRRSAID